MTADREQNLRGWAKFLNPESLRSNLIVAAIFMASYETLRTAIIDRIKEFFTHGFTQDGPIVGDEYRSKVLTLDKSELRASLLWLRSMDAIDDSDVQVFDAIRQHRNELAHELVRFVTSVDAEMQVDLLVALRGLLTKIERWWIREVEIPTDPDYDGSEISDDGIHSGSMLFLQMMIDIATGKDPSAYWDAWQQLAKTRFPGAFPSEP